MDKKRIYIAGCVTNGGMIPEANYTQKFIDAENLIRASGHEPLSPTMLPHNHARRWQDYMTEALHVMLDCDAVLALPCWKRSKGGDY